MKQDTIIIAGPCVIESMEVLDEVARQGLV